MSQSVAPQDPQGWAEFLQHRPLPVRGSFKRRLERELASERSTLGTLGQIIKSDPVACLHLTKVANALHGEKGSTVTGINHVVQSLGFDRIAAVVRDIPTLRLNAHAVSQKMFCRAVAYSHFAGLQALEWQKRKNAMFAEECQLAALFYAVGHWMMWLYAPLHMSRIQDKIRRHHVDVVLAETDVLGCTLQEISLQLVAEWGLPALTAESLDHSTSPDHDMLTLMHRRALNDLTLEDDEIRSLKHLLQARFFPVKLANWLAITASFGWRQKKLGQITTIIGDYLRVKSDEVLLDLHRTCAHSSQLFHIPGTLAPATELIMLPSEIQLTYTVTDKEARVLAPDSPALPPEAAHTPRDSKAVSASAHQPLPPFRNERLFKTLAAALSQGTGAINQPTQVLQVVIKALHEGLGMSRVILFRLQRGELRCSANIGVEPTDPLLDFRFDLEVPSLFKRLCDKPACLWIESEQRDQLLRSLPDSYHEHVPASGAVMLSVFHKGRPVALIQADTGSSAHLIQASHNKRARTLCGAAQSAMRLLD